MTGGQGRLPSESQGSRGSWGSRAQALGWETVTLGLWGGLVMRVWTSAVLLVVFLSVKWVQWPSPEAGWRMGWEEAGPGNHVVQGRGRWWSGWSSVSFLTPPKSLLGRGGDPVLFLSALCFQLLSKQVGLLSTFSRAEPSRWLRRALVTDG